MKKRIKEDKSKNKEQKSRSKIQGNSFGSSGFTLGVVALIFLGIFGVVFSITGFVFCFIQQKNKKTKLGKAGLILTGKRFVLRVCYGFCNSSIMESNNQQSYLG
jgi:hypothetical protein